MTRLAATRPISNTYSPLARGCPRTTYPQRHLLISAEASTNFNPILPTQLPRILPKFISSPVAVTPSITHAFRLPRSNALTAPKPSPAPAILIDINSPIYHAISRLSNRALAATSHFQDTTLTHHLRACHLLKQPAARRSIRKSCQRCIVKERKYKQARPCEGCVKSHVSCEYTSPEPEDSILNNINIPQDFSDCSRPPPLEQERRQVNDFIFINPSSGMGSVIAADNRYLTLALQTPPTSNSGDELAFSSCHFRSQDRLFHSLLADFSPTSPSAPGIFSVSQPVTDEAFTDANGSIPITGETLSLNFLVPSPPNFRISGLDWLNFDMPNFSIDSEP